MSLTERVSLKCPECGKIQNPIIWKSLNSTLDAEARNTLFEDGINVFSCADCGKRIRIDTSLLYHDMKLKFTVLYLPFAFLENETAFGWFEKNGQLVKDEDEEVDEQFADHYLTTHHVVFDFGELLRYIIFREKLNDHHNAKNVTK
jgi:hypothetical protein